jgi:hypothetical protein
MIVNFRFFRGSGGGAGGAEQPERDHHDDDEQAKADQQLQVAGQQLEAVPVVLLVERVVAAGEALGRGVVDQPALQQPRRRVPEVRPGGEQQQDDGRQRVPGGAQPGLPGRTAASTISASPGAIQTQW